MSPRAVLSFSDEGIYPFQELLFLGSAATAWRSFNNQSLCERYQNFMMISQRKEFPVPYRRRVSLSGKLRLSLLGVGDSDTASKSRY
jgi:hypothetical protein